MQRRSFLTALAAAGAVAITPGAARAASSTFEDVGPDSTHADGIAWAHERGLVEGFGDGTFRPDEPVTRGQLASILASLDPAFPGSG